MADIDATLPLPEAEQVLHYRLLEKLGGGGMGVVYKAGRSVVRELYRNLTTAQGTRAVRDREELLSVFGRSSRRRRRFSPSWWTPGC